MSDRRPGLAPHLRREPPPGGAAVTDEAAEADEIANLVNRLTISHANPEQFHLVRDEAAKRLRRMAKRLRGEGNRPPTTVWRPSR
jgi:hypothetical protein